MQALITPPPPLATQRLDTGDALQRLHRQQQIQQDIARKAQAKYHGSAQRIPIGSLVVFTDMGGGQDRKSGLKGGAKRDC